MGRLQLEMEALRCSNVLPGLGTSPPADQEQSLIPSFSQIHPLKGLSGTPGCLSHISIPNPSGAGTSPPHPILPSPGHLCPPWGALCRWVPLPAGPHGTEGPDTVAWGSPRPCTQV